MIKDIPGHCAVATCGIPLPKYRRRWCSDSHAIYHAQNHSWGYARETALKRDGFQCVKCGSKAWLEVNHIFPRMGRGYGTGCQHHQANLETLCHECHVKITNKQRREQRNRNQTKLPL